MQPSTGDRRRVKRHNSTAVLRRTVYDAITQATREGMDEAARIRYAIAAVLAVEPDVTEEIARTIVGRLRPS